MRWFATLIVLAACSKAPEPQPLTRVGVTPPAITLTTTAGARVSLAEITGAHDQNIVVFYRGFY